MDKKFVFLLGAGRSGTTLLYKILSLHPQVGYISNYDATFPKWIPTGILSRLLAPNIALKKLAWFKKGGNAYFHNRSLLHRICPTPVEGEKIYRESGISQFFKKNHIFSESAKTCLRKRLCKMAQLSGSEVFLNKRTANNRRIPLLNEIFPDAFFINLIRDGRCVAHSLSKVSWFANAPLWWNGKKPQELIDNGENCLQICAKNWVYEVRELDRGIKRIGKDRIIETRYENLVDNPIKELTRILFFLDLPLNDLFFTAIKSLDIKPMPKKWQSSWDKAQLDIVLNEERQLLGELKYL